MFLNTFHGKIASAFVSFEELMNLGEIVIWVGCVPCSVGQSSVPGVVVLQ